MKNFIHMKNIFKLPSKIVVKVSTLLTIIISLIINRHRLLFLQYLIAFIHEIFHCIGAIIFKLNVNKITFLPFGFYAEIDNLYNVKWYQELLIVVLGPLSFIISSIIIKILYINGSISLLLYNEINKTNIFILIFNLLPIYPLDGYRIIKIFFELYFTERKVLKIVNVISFVMTIFMFSYGFNTNQIFIISFLVFNQYIMFISLKKIYRNFLISKTNKNNNTNYKMHFFEDLYRPFNNLIIKNKKLYNEKEFSIYLLNKREKNE